ASALVRRGCFSQGREGELPSYVLYGNRQATRGLRTQTIRTQGVGFVHGNHFRRIYGRDKPSPLGRDQRTRGRRTGKQKKPSGIFPHPRKNSPQCRTGPALSCVLDERSVL